MLGGRRIILTLTSNHALNQFSMNSDLKMKDKVIKLLAFTINIKEPLQSRQRFLKWNTKKR